MADIAILVAEEYERRTKRPLHPCGTAVPRQDSVGLVSFASALAQKIEIKIVLDRLEVVRQGFSEPKTQIALEASHCFFSA